MDIIQTHELISRELDYLRRDLQALKNCQLQYLTLAITSSGAIIGLSALFETASWGVAILAPLCVILPTWLIFFDKATTITRIVGYQMLLEKQLCASSILFNFIGYENALVEFRLKEGDAELALSGRIQVDHPGIIKVLLLQTRYRFWMINWWTFAFLAFICCVGSFSILFKNPVIISLPFGLQICAPERYWWVCSAIVIVLIVACYTYRLILSLTQGWYTYNACAAKWAFILKKEAVMTSNMERTVDCSEALKGHGIFTRHTQMDNGQYRFRLESEEGSAYIRTEAKGKAAWQKAHHHEIKETYIVQAGWMALAWRSDKKLQVKIYGPDKRFTLKSNDVHNVYLPATAIIHTVKHGTAEDLHWYEDLLFDDETTILTEEDIVRLDKICEEYE